MKIEKIVVASHNQGKIKEFRNMLAPYHIEVVSAAELDLPDVEETGVTFEENARLKADSLAEISGLPCLADDSGLCVNALDGRPGVYSARYAPNRDFNKGMEKLLKELKDSKSNDRSAYFTCVLALSVPGAGCQIFEGRVDGELATTPRGDSGFGYDPIFVPKGYDRTFAEFAKEAKNQISHRGLAFKKFAHFLQTTLTAE